MKQPFPFTGVSGSMSIVVRRISGTLPEPHIWVRSYLGDMIGTSSAPLLKFVTFCVQSEGT